MKSSEKTRSFFFYLVQTAEMAGGGWFYFNRLRQNRYMFYVNGWGKGKFRHSQAVR
jgi:hypothetical protein